MSETRRRVERAVALFAALVVATAALIGPAGATPLAQTDAAAFTSRADAWTQARNELRDAAREQALRLAEEARQAEAERLAAEEAARVAEAERRAAEEIARTSTTTAPPTTTTAPPTTTVAPSSDGAVSTTTTAAPAAPGQPTAAQWDVLRQCESSGNYSIVSANGRYRGAYQFSQATWDWVAGLDHPGLLGVDPSTAAPADQDAMALSLWIRRGWSPWPICGAKASAV